MTPLTFQILGIDPANKGACLMLAAIQEALSARFEAPRIGVDIATMPVEARLQLGLWGVSPASWVRSRVKGPIKSALLRRVSGPAARMGLLHEADVDVVLDASGFAYGDFWKKSKFEMRLGGPMARWKQQGKVVIALPQAWGGFEEPGFAQAVRAGLSQADLVFARDPQSFAYLTGTGLTGVEQAPDFTNLLRPPVPPQYADLAGAGFVIPNSKMLEARGDAARDDYLAFLKQAVITLQAITPEVHILIHEGKKDAAIADALNAALPTPLRVIDPPDALAVKAILGTAGALISSRFHGLVSALSAGVPSLACGWSHKYEALLSDYGAAHHTIDLGQPQSWESTLARFAQDAGAPAFKEALSQASSVQKERAQAAWDLIGDTIAKRTGRH